MSNSISLPFLIIATGTILFVYMSVVIMELRSAYEESFWKQALKIGGIIFTLITLLFLGLDFVLTRFREKAFLLAPGMPILGIILVYMRSIVLAWRWRNRNWKNMASELDTDRYNTSGGHNIRETKAIITAFARHKLTDDFPDNLDTLDLPLDYSYFKKRETRLSGGVITNGKKEIPIHDIRRVKCITNGTISNLCIYTTDKGRFFFDMPKMTVTLNALTVPLLEAVMTRNTGHGIDFSRGDGFGQSTSEFVIIRYLDSGYFLHKDGTAHEDWQKTACDRTAGYGYDLKMLLQE